MHSIAPGWWDRWTDRVTAVAGGRWTFLGNVFLTVVWLGLGPVYHWSDQWQLWANTITTVVTYIMVFIIQHAQNKADAAIQLKLDELIRALPQPRSELAGIEQAGEDAIQHARLNGVLPDDDDAA